MLWGCVGDGLGIFSGRFRTGFAKKRKFESSELKITPIDDRKDIKKSVEYQFKTNIIINMGTSPFDKFSTSRTGKSHEIQKWPRNDLEGLKLHEIEAANSFPMLQMALNGLNWPVMNPIFPYLFIDFEKTH